MEEDMTDKLNNNMKKVTTMLEFLIVQPNLLTNMVDIEREKIMVQNLLRVRCSELWSQKMIKEIELKCSKESIKAVDDLFKIVEVTRTKSS